ncbi:hypothetical protein CAC42_1966 [Sphaceloma murrayae]|uniref:C2H2-type domain-containing protein n=1 Tax=Sphaceloma murrayae TaxID=2082308 RepID=A0A2K1QMZ0_9PEZI|nr:hypothetical protein CAC42_1966 [Sphaceloma murrayae]
MDSTDPFFLSDQLWDPNQSIGPIDMPPAKRAKTSHPPHSVICCDQPCPEDDLCWEDFCHDFCTELCKQPCDDCPEPHNGNECDDPHCAMPECTDVCASACAEAHCDLSCQDAFCDADTLDACADPSTACFDDCGNWCNHHGLNDCLDCTSSPATSVARTPQLPTSVFHAIRFQDPFDTSAFNQQFTGRTYTPFLAQTPQSTYHTPSYPTTQYAGPQHVSHLPYATQHICKVKGCMAGDFKDEDALQEHIEQKHLVKINNRYVCQWEGCVKKVTKKSNEHMQKEKEARALGLTYQPPSEPFSDDHLHKLKRHYYVHSGKKAFECDFPGCGSVHATKAQLKVHKARHNPKEFNCENCDKVFTTQNQLKTHVNAVHKKQKHFKCPDCDYACDDSSNMSSHKRKQHQLGVLCPSHIDLSCAYRDGRQSEMEKHMRACNHSTWMLGDDDSFDAYWKTQKKSTPS